ncbi:MAG: flavodoxin family protein [Firmicutes bacterium]|jgi:multimeric flavodoxin WrbA|nr:flavodoxin family protein [Bacillota bacterium]
MKVMLVNGSPNKEGCTYTALTEVAKTLNQEGIETEMFWIGNKPISGCIACRKCRTTGRCAIDDVVNEFRDIAEDADGFIFGTPVHYAAPSGNMTSFMDRLFYTDHGNADKMFYLKPAACVIAARRAGTTATYDQMNKYFGLHQMPIISARYWNMVHGAKPEDVYEDKEGLYNMRVLARNMAFFLKCKQVALQHGVKLPEREAPVFTNFVR